MAIAMAMTFFPAVLIAPEVAVVTVVPPAPVAGFGLAVIIHHHHLSGPLWRVVAPGWLDPAIFLVATVVRGIAHASTYNGASGAPNDCTLAAADLLADDGACSSADACA
ncbi:MAG: hypothetical protein RL032_2286 [Pseudomonadota bacterium]|jgi:hypothetical protein